MGSTSMEEIVTGYGLVEGPRVDSEDRLYFSDARSGGVYCREPSGKIETIVPKRRGVGGIALHGEGGIVISGKNVCHVRSGSTRVVFDVADAPGFNDLFTDAKGRVLVGSQRYNPFAPDAEMVPGELYRIGPGGESEQLYGDVGLTNGIGFSPDQTRLYHSDSARGHIIVHDVSAEGELSGRSVLAATPRGAPDGLAVDERGRIWVASFGAGCLTCFTPAGEVDCFLELPAKGVASLCFGGADRRDLYVATADKSSAEARGGTIFKTRVDVPGLPVPEAQV